jgi:cation transport ATPase
VLGRSTPDVLSSSSSENEGVELQLPSKEEKVSMEDENETGVELPEQLDKERRKREEIEKRVQELEVKRNKQKNLERQLEKEKRQREKAERREQELEAEQQREQTKIQREQCKQRRSLKENQKKSELELEQKDEKITTRTQKTSRLLVVWVVVLILGCVGNIFLNSFIDGKPELEFTRRVLDVAFWVAFWVLFFCIMWSLWQRFQASNDYRHARHTYHMWINCYDAYPPTPFRLF